MGRRVYVVVLTALTAGLLIGWARFVPPSSPAVSVIEVPKVDPVKYVLPITDSAIGFLSARYLQSAKPSQPNSNVVMPERMSWRLLGIVSTGDDRHVLIARGGKVERLTLEDTLDSESVLRDISADRITVTTSSGEQVIPLFRDP